MIIIIPIIIHDDSYIILTLFFFLLYLVSMNLQIISFIFIFVILSLLIPLFSSKNRNKFKILSLLVHFTPFHWEFRNELVRNSSVKFSTNKHQFWRNKVYLRHWNFRHTHSKTLINAQEFGGQCEKKITFILCWCIDVNCVKTLHSTFRLLLVYDHWIGKVLSHDTNGHSD